MLRASCQSVLGVLLGVQFVLGCQGDDDKTAEECTVAVPCEGHYAIENESDLEAIARCESISGDLRFEGQSWLTIIALPCLTTVGDELFIGDNDALTSLDMPALTSAGYFGLHIEDNAALTSLDGLSNLTTVDGDLDIYENDCLSQAEAEAFAAGLSVGWSVSVHDNGAHYPCD